MEVDSNPRSLDAIPCMGTKNLNQCYPATLGDTNPKTVAEAFEEAKLYKALKKKDEMNSNQESGTKAYVVSKKWIKAYETYILYDQFNYGFNESRVNEDKSFKDDHFTSNHPG